jgi:bifunctional DNA-binding transcriptional regulator/antitoxin component of YhaV-PrlF toxin-antitoxin module
MATLDFGVRPVRRVNYNRVVSLPKPWLRDKGIEDHGAVCCFMNEAGDLVLSPAKTDVEKNARDLEQKGGKPKSAPGRPDVVATEADPC